METDELPKAFHWVGNFPNKIALADGSFFFSFAVQKSSKHPYFHLMGRGIDAKEQYSREGCNRPD
jgi:hypothetical protein